MDFIEKLILNHVMASHGVCVALSVILARIDHIIAFALKIFSAQQIDAAIDKAAAAAKTHVDQDAAQQPKP